MTEKNDSNEQQQQRLPTTLELQEMIKELAIFCDDLKQEIALVRKELILHEHGKNGVLVPVQLNQGGA